MKLNLKYLAVIAVLFIYTLVLRNELFVYRIHARSISVNAETRHAVGLYSNECVNVVPGAAGNVVSGQFLELRSGEYIAKFNVPHEYNGPDIDGGVYDILFKNSTSEKVVFVSPLLFNSNSKFKIAHFLIDDSYKDGIFDFRVFSNGSKKFSFCGLTVERLN